MDLVRFVQKAAGPFVVAAAAVAVVALPPAQHQGPSVALAARTAPVSGTAGSPCKFAIHVTVSKQGAVHYSVSGPCQPSKATVRRAAREIGNPSWFRLFRIRPHSVIACGGNCGTSAQITDRGQVFVS